MIFDGVWFENLVFCNDFEDGCIPFLLCVPFFKGIGTFVPLTSYLNFHLHQSEQVVGQIH